MSTRLYVGNLHHSVRDSHLAQLFGAFGSVTSAEVVADALTGKSHCYGYVEMLDDAEAERAIRVLDDALFGVLRIHVCKAQPRPMPPSHPFLQVSTRLTEEQMRCLTQSGQIKWC